MSTSIQVSQSESAVPTNLETFVIRAMNDQTVDVDKLERLVALMERREAQQRKERFDNALAACQAEMPRIAQNGLIDMGNKGRISYAKLEDIDACIRPIYGDKGFSVRYDAPAALEGGRIRIVAHFSCAGHTESSELTLPPDTGPGRNAAQAVASSIAYGRRHLLKMFFNLIEEGSDKNGANRDDLKTISQDQADDLRAKVEEVKGNMAVLLKMLRVNSVEEIRFGQLAEAYNAIEAKRRK